MCGLLVRLLNAKIKKKEKVQNDVSAYSLLGVHLVSGIRVCVTCENSPQVLALFARQKNNFGALSRMLLPHSCLLYGYKSVVCISLESGAARFSTKPKRGSCNPAYGWVPPP